MPSSTTGEQPGEPDPAELAARYGLARTTARPSLLGYLQQLWQRRDFIRAYSSARATAQYSASRLGQLWQIVTPLLNAGVYFILFGVLLQLDRGIANFPAYLVTGVFAFTFMQRSLNNGAKAIGDNLALVRALHFPRAMLPLSSVFVELRQIMISMCALFLIIPLTGIIKGTGDTIMWSWVLVVPVVGLHMLFNVGISLVMARIGAVSQDINQLLPVLTRIWFYSSGVFYNIKYFGERIEPQWLQEILFPIIKLNPGAVFLDLYRTVLIESHEPLNLPLGLNVWEAATGWALLFLVGGFIFFWRKEEVYGRG
ncbi:teichoic acid transport system permease protein [Haloechinothrix alba]|uniref:Teichoic acid transport system permease protein n=1 Tax=Haloechinothrix alba TaxID=664784 RepID=A0A238UXG8_9PSEU|nr:ABC transporter permease [Haloechinothrix alba]SNR26972.1 teichoic acid transport system permease protein [Haloechinothrix alba]